MFLTFLMVRLKYLRTGFSFSLTPIWLKYTMAACAGLAIVNVSKYSKGWLGKGWIFEGGHSKGWLKNGLGF